MRHFSTFVSRNDKNVKKCLLCKMAHCRRWHKSKVILVSHVAGRPKDPIFG